jgi:hypothetical protein
MSGASCGQIEICWTPLGGCQTGLFSASACQLTANTLIRPQIMRKNIRAILSKLSAVARADAQPPSQRELHVAFIQTARRLKWQASND